MKPQAHLEIVYLPTDQLVEYANNAKLHPVTQVDEIVASVEEFNFNDPISCWHNEAGEPEIVEGHGRLMALKRLGITEAPVIFLDHLTDEQRRAYTHVHNQLTLSSGFDLGILEVELDSIVNIDMSQFGFDTADIDFEEFDGLGDGGGSRMGSGSGCRVVIGPHIADIKEDGDECFRRAKALDPDDMIRFIHDALMSGDLS